MARKTGCESCIHRTVCDVGCEGMGICFFYISRERKEKKLRKVKVKVKDAYVCYEANENQLAVECGTVNQVRIIRNEEDVHSWIKERIAQEIKDGFVIDDDYEFSEEKVKKEIKRGYVGVMMFRSYQENWGECFEIIAEKKAIE